MSQMQSHRIITSLLGLGCCVFLLFSLTSFNVCDWPNPDVAPRSPQFVSNLCGLTGAFLSYYSFYYFGNASYVILFSIAFWLIMRCMQKPVEQIILRSIGVLLIGVVLSTTNYLVNHGDLHSLSIGNGGIIGIATGHFLLANTALTGAVLILLAAAIVGLLLSADNILMAIPGLLIQLAERVGRAGPVLSGIGKQWPSRQSSGTAVVPARSQRDAAIMAVADLDEETEEETDKEEDTSQDEQDTVDKESKSSEDGVVEIARKKSVKAVSTALAQMLGKSTSQRSALTFQSSQEDFSEYKYPPIDLLTEPEHGYSSLQEKVVRERAKILEQTLKEFNISASVVEAETGPVITMFELKLAPGIKVAQISNLSNDLARSLGSPAVRIVAPIPGKHTIGIEVPNSEKEKVRIRELIELSGDRPSKMQLPLFLGKDGSGEALVSDLTSMPHLLIAGTTGSGKSVCINSIITSIMITQRPDLVKLILVDPKMVEMNAFRDIPHLMCPIVTEMKKAEQILEWLTVKMDERYALLAEARVRNIIEYNKLSKEDIYERFAPSNEEEKAKIPVRLPYLVIVIDELADLMMTSAKEVEGYIIRLAQKSRAVGIHIVLATQRPQASVVTGLIKSNLPSRISFRVAARMDSRIVLDQNGAETLLGQGDMLFLKPGTSDLVRAQGTFLGDDEVHRIVKFLREVAQPSYHPELVQLNHFDTENFERDELFDDAVRIILETRRGSVSLLQRRLTIGYSRASRLIDQMAMAGIVGEYKGSQAREVLITTDEYEAIRRQMETDAANGYADLQEVADNDVVSDVDEEETESPDLSDESEDTLEDADDVEEEEDEEEYEYEYVDADEEDEEFEEEEEDDDEEEQR